jgi:hypothetical protein
VAASIFARPVVGFAIVGVVYAQKLLDVAINGGHPQHSAEEGKGNELVKMPIRF